MLLPHRPKPKQTYKFKTNAKLMDERLPQRAQPQSYFRNENEN